jgi:NADPH:quinone reductase-like Zn-dependent oxidoreductase
VNSDGTPRPTPIVPGHEVAGVVEGVGSAAVDVATGDAVYGLIDFHRDGADAQYVAVRAGDLAPKPAALTFAEAAAAPLSALTAWQALFDHGDLRTGQRVLVHGGAGGVGTFAVQLARWCGAHVATTASVRDAELLRELGADEVIDYRAQRFDDVLTDVDVVLDTVGGDTWERSWRVLGPGGRLVSIAVPRPPDREGPDGQRAIWFVVRPDREHLVELGRLFDSGQLRAIVSAIVPLAEGRGAYGPGRSGHGPGKVVLLVDE